MCRAKRPPRPSPSRPSRRPMRARQITTDDLIDFTPAMRAEAVRYRQEILQDEPDVRARRGLQSHRRLPSGAMDIGTLGGGTNWPGAGFNPETHVVFAPAANAGVSMMGLVPLPEGLSDLKYRRRHRRPGLPHQWRSGLRFGLGCAQGQRRRPEAGRGAGRPSADCGRPAAAAQRATACRWSSRLMACSPPSTWIPATPCGRCPMATRRMKSRTIRR